MLTPNHVLDLFYVCACLHSAVVHCMLSPVALSIKDIYISVQSCCRWCRIACLHGPQTAGMYAGRFACFYTDVWYKVNWRGTGRKL